jgi:hypothetical protein
VGIARVIEDVMARCAAAPMHSLEDVMMADAVGRREAQAAVAMAAGVCA